MAKKIAIFPGSFDPFTKGHYDLVQRALPLFDEIIIAIGQNTTKQRYFDIEKVTKGINGLFANGENVRVMPYKGLTVKFAKEVGASVILRGLRNAMDFEYEKSIAESNKLLGKIETVFLLTSPEYAAINSTIVREIHKNDGDISTFVPYQL